MKRFIERFRHSIAFRITGVFLALLLVSTVGVVLTVRYYVQHDLEESTRDSLVGAMGRLESELYQLRNELSLFAELSARSTILQGQAQEMEGASVQVNLVERSRDRGIEIDSYVWGGKNVPSTGILDRAFSGISTVDYAFYGDGPGRMHIIAAAPSGFFGEDRRVSSASISLGREFLRQKRASVGGEVSLVSKGEIVASSSACLECLECLIKILDDPAQWSALESGKSIYMTFDCKPSPQAAVATPIRTFDGKTAAIVIFRSREGERRALYHATLGITGGTLAFSLAMGTAFFLLTSRALRPLTELTRIAGGIMEGRYGETVPVQGKGEVADLAQAFNRMSVSLKDAMGEISEWNRMLENRVEEKTEELEKIHRRMVEVEKLAAMGQLAAGVAHELNNPLSGIMGYSEIALELYRNRPPEQVTPQEIAKMISYFSQIDALSQRCRTIILDMLKFARQHTEEFRDINLSEVVRETLLFLDKQLSHANVKVNTELAGDLPFIRGNGMQLQQVFTNLILNAVQAMPGGGTLDVRTRRNGDAVEAEFVDHGMGIDPKLVHRIFEPFFTTKPVGKGTGLGLSVSYGIVKHHGGEIRVSSDPGKGSTFLVVIPLHPQG
ncbi:MAG: HAMP domain-containing protein [Deltaproteobacteria bacterium]|nr:HAMP domain-containing protein [Deltaproteobacteria bacterium]